MLLILLILWSMSGNKALNPAKIERKIIDSNLTFIKYKASAASKVPIIAWERQSIVYIINQKLKG